MNIKQLIKESVQSAITEEKRKSYIRQVIKEEMGRILNEESDSNNMKRNALMNALKDTKYNHAQMAYDLWHPKDQSEKDTLRSLFSKKATGKPDNDGAIRKFSDEEINKLYQMIRRK